MRRQLSMIKRSYAVLFLAALIGMAGLTVDGTYNLAVAQLTEADCRACHDENYISRGLPKTGVAELHHRPQRANLWSCGYCHNPAEPETMYIMPEKTAKLDCTVCHSDLGHAADHDNASASSASCAECHSANVVTEHLDNQSLDCATCHESLDPTVQDVITQGKAGTMVYCVDCHVGVDHIADHDNAVAPSASCADCHNANVVTEHVDNQGLTCNTCHADSNPTIQDAISQGMAGTTVYCADCHGVNDHHTHTEAQTGNCTYCHADPRLAVDANAPSGQLACVQCHGTNKHNNGGPIQDYGACFACHQPTPYHAKPTEWPGFYGERANPIGRGTFNLFYDEFRPNCAPNCKDTWIEDLSGYGKDGTPSNDRGTSWTSPTISYNMVTFYDYFNTNQEWTVPTFEAGGGGATDTVTVIYAKFNDNNNRLEVFAESDQGQSATLTLTYKGSNYSMYWDSSDEHWYRVISSSTCSGESIDVTSSEGGSANNSSILHCP